MKKLSNAEFVETLRAMADLYEANPILSIPMDFGYGWMRVYINDENAKEQYRSLGSFTKRIDEDKFVATKRVGHIDLEFRTKRERVCKRIVTGTRIVPQEIVPESYTPSQVIPEHEEEIVEWDCEPIMAETEVGEVEKVGM